MILDKKQSPEGEAQKANVETLVFKQSVISHILTLYVVPRDVVLY